MPTRAGDRPGLGGAAKLVADRARSIVRLEIELAVSELKRKVAALGIGIAMLVGAAIFVVFALGFALATIAAALATAVSTWLALLIVTGGALPARRTARRARAPRDPQGHTAHSRAGDPGRRS